jgi:hypothetical protein
MDSRRPSRAGTHEAGHAVTATVLGHKVTWVSVKGDGTGQTRVLYPDTPEGRRDKAIVALGGPLAEKRVHGTSGGYAVDMLAVNHRRDLKKLTLTAAKLVSKHQRLIERVARALDAERHLTQEQIMKLVIGRDGKQRFEEDDYIIQDGEGVRIPMYAMDSLQRTLAANMPPVPSVALDALALHRPGFRSGPDAAEQRRHEAADSRKAILSDAWRHGDTPKPAVAAGVATDAAATTHAKRAAFLESQWRR